MMKLKYLFPLLFVLTVIGVLVIGEKDAFATVRGAGAHPGQTVPLTTSLATGVSGAGQVNANPPGGVYIYGQTVTLTAAPDPGWSFDHWESETTPALPWWNDGWDYRVPIDVGAQGTARTDQPVEVALNFTDLLATLGVSGQFDDQSIRLVEIDGDGNVINDQVPAQFDRDGGYDPATQASGSVVFFMAGQTAQNQTRHFHLYFGLNDRSYPAPAFTPPVKLTANGVVDEGLDAFKIETLRGTYYYQKVAGGFSSLVDVDGNDWINHHPTPGSGSAGEYRGIPNAVHPSDGGYLHPGKTTATSSILNQGPVRVTIKTLVREPVTQTILWDVRWTIYPTHATMRLVKNATNYWFLYEGTPGGVLEPNTDFIVRSNGIQTPASDSWTGDLNPAEWCYFADPNVGEGRSLFLVQHGDNDVVDSYWPMNNEMTVFGFGRDDSQRYFTETPTMFSIGLMDETAYEASSTIIASVIQPLSVTVNDPEVRYPVTETLPASNPLALTMDYNRRITAIFIQDEYMLTVGVDGDGSGTVTRDPDAAYYHFDDQVALTAHPNRGSRFGGWSGPVDGQGFTTTVTLYGDTAVTATFDQEQYTVQVMQAGDGAGAVAVDPPKDVYVYGDNVTFLATPAVGSDFIGWSGAINSSEISATATIQGDTIVTATFALEHYALQVDAESGGQAFRQPEQTSYAYGQQVTLKAEPDPGYAFVDWQGDLAGDDNPAILLIDGDKTVVARFVQVHTVAVNVDGQGVVRLTPDMEGRLYPHGSDVTLEAIPAVGWGFVGWGGDLAGADNPTTLTMDANKQIVARFARLHTLTIDHKGGGAVVQTPLQPAAGYTQGAQVTLEAIPDPAWHFTGWSGDLTGAENPAIVTVNDDMSITARFVRRVYLPLVANP